MIQLLIADDHPIILESLMHIIDAQEDMKIVANASNGQEVINYLEEFPEITLAILDLNMPIMNGLECMVEIQKRFPNVKVLFLTIYQEAFVIKRLMSLGAKGILLKNTDKEQIVDCIRQIVAGKTCFDKFESIINKGRYEQETVHLTEREKEIIQLVAEGLSSAEIGDKLFIAELTAQTHRKNILRKLELSNTAQLVSFARTSGIIK